MKALVLDLDDTLYPEVSFVRSGFWAVANWLETETDAPATKAFAFMWEAHLRGGRGHIFDQLLARMPNVAGIQVESLVDRYRNHRPELSFHPGIEACLAAAKAKGLRLALISDGPLAAQTRKVEALNLADWANPIILTDAWGSAFWKPHPRAFALVEETLGYQGAELAYLADNPEKDFHAPNQRGWLTIRLRLPDQLKFNVEPASDIARPALEFASIPDLGRWLDALPFV